MKTYAVLGAGGSFGIHTALYLLDHGDAKVVVIGRNPLLPAPFSLGIEKHPRYQYHAYHITYELDSVLEVLDRERPQVIVNYAAQGEGAVSWKKSWRDAPERKRDRDSGCATNRFLEIMTLQELASIRRAHTQTPPHSSRAHSYTPPHSSRTHSHTPLMR